MSGRDEGRGRGRVSSAFRSPAMRLATPSADRGDLAVAQLGPLDGLEHARGLGADGRPALRVEARERRPVVRR